MHVDMAEPETIIQYKVTQTPTSGVCVECSFLEESAKYCVVIIHENVLCFGLSQCEVNLTNIVTSFKIARSGDIGHGCVQNINVTNYQVGVIRGSLIFTMTPSKISKTKILTYSINNFIELISLLFSVRFVWSMVHHCDR